MYENSAALAQYNHIKESEKKSEVDLGKNVQINIIDLEMAANMLEEDEEV